MNQYLVTILPNEADLHKTSPAEMKALVEGFQAYTRKLHDIGAFIDGEKLRPSPEGKRVHRERNAVIIQDGPFAETKETLGGYYLLQAESLDAAVEIAKDCPMLATDVREVRPVVRSKISSDKLGKIFSFAVVGHVENEAAWADIFDKIDAGSSDRFPKETLLGGVRLQPPTTGKRIVAQQGIRSVVDGPFSESKEVIGGLFFMRMTHIDDAVHWAKKSLFAMHSTLEIRELWLT